MKRLRIGSTVIVGAVIGAFVVGALVAPAAATGPAAHAAARQAATKAATGAPIKVMTLGEFEVAALGSKNPEVAGGVQARAKAINKAGGLTDASGTKHKVQVVVCNTNNDPNVAAQCARSAVDQKVTAVVSPYTTLGSSVYPVLEQAGIPAIGAPASEPVQLSSRVSFPLVAGPIGAFLGMVKALAAAGSTKIAVVYPDLPAASAVLPVVESAATASGMKLQAKVAVPGDATDLAPQVAAATANGTDGILGFVIGDQNGKLFDALASSGYKGKIATASVFLTQNLLSTLKTQLNGALVVNLTTPITTKGVPGVKLFVKDMNAFDKSMFKSDAAEWAWASMWVFERVAKTLPDITPATVLDAMGKLDNFDMGGLTPPLTTTHPYTGGVFDLPRLFNPYVVAAKIVNGRVVRTSSQFVNAFAK